jgi:vacuolar-type H+-ATPase subunit H
VGRAGPPRSCELLDEDDRASTFLVASRRWTREFSSDTRRLPGPESGVTRLGHHFEDQETDMRSNGKIATGLAALTLAVTGATACGGDDVEQGVNDAQEQVQDAGQDAQRQGEEAVEGARQQGEEAVEGAQQQGEEAVEGAQQQGEEAVEGAQQQGEEAAGDAEREAEEATDGEG